MRELWRGEAASADCDALGLTLSGIVARTGEALDALGAELGLGSFESARATSALRVRELRIRRLGSAPAGSGVVVTGGVERLDETSLVARLSLRPIESEDAAATIAIVADHIETDHAKIFPWTSRTVKAADSLRVRPAAAPEQVNATAARPGAMLGEMTGQGVFQLADADAFGRVRTASVLRRALDSGCWPFPAPPAADGPQPARLEARLQLLAYPAPGDRYVAMSDVAGDTDSGRWSETRVLWTPTGSAAWAQLDLACAWLDPATGQPADLSAAPRKPNPRA